MINFPNTRLEYADVGNPLFVTDIVNATESLQNALRMIYGLPSNGFAICSGLAYGSGAYGPGIVFMNNVFYYTAGLAENKYLAPANSDILIKVFQDANSHVTYREFRAVQSNSPVGGMPQFIGDMNQYRISSHLIQTTLNNLINNLGTAATKNIGESVGNVPESGGFTSGDYLTGYPGVGGDIVIKGKSVSDTRTEIVGDNTLKKVIEVGLWNMQTTELKQVDITSSGIDITKILRISVMIKGDGSNVYSPLDSVKVISSNPTVIGGILPNSIGSDGNNIDLHRYDLGGLGYDSSYYSGTSVSRGKMLIEYLP
jgi:hypothetical protein